MHTYTFSQRIWATKYLLWRAFDIPWEHITPEAIDTYFRAKYAKERSEEERRAQEAAQRKEASKLTPEEKASVMAMFDDLQRQSDEADAKAAKNAASNNADTANGKNADEKANKSDNTNTDRNVSNNTDTNTPVPDTPTTRGETAIANALARNPNVDLDTALQNHHATAGIPKQNLTHEQIYDAITAEANFQKRQAIIQNRLRAKNPDAPEDNAPPKSRSP